MFTVKDEVATGEFVKNMAESSARMMNAWNEAIKNAGGNNAYLEYDRLMRSWTNSLDFMKLMDSMSTGMRFKDFVNFAAQDLPEIFKHYGDEEKISQIKDKWMKYHEKMVQDIFGLLSPSQIEKAIAPWRSFLDNFTRSWGTGFMGRPFPFNNTSSEGIFPAWSELYENTMGQFFRMPGLGLTREYEEEFKKAMDAQMRFLNTLPDFQEQVIAASKAAMDKVFDHISKMDIKEFGPETYQVFYKIWVSSSEDAFIEVFRSETFSRTLANTVNRGLEAKKNMDTLLAKGLTVMNVPNDKDMDEVYQAVYEMKKRTRKIEQELADIKRRLSDGPNKESI